MNGISRGATDQIQLLSSANLSVLRSSALCSSELTYEAEARQPHYESRNATSTVQPSLAIAVSGNTACASVRSSLASQL